MEGFMSRHVMGWRRSLQTTFDENLIMGRKKNYNNVHLSN